MKRPRLDKEEQELLDSFEKGEWRPVAGKEQEKRRFAKIAHDTIRKDQRVNIRISSKDLEGLKKKAIEEGIPYQTLISSILHKYVSGTLKDKAA